MDSWYSYKIEDNQSKRTFDILNNRKINDYFIQIDILSFFISKPDLKYKRDLLLCC